MNKPTRSRMSALARRDQILDAVCQVVDLEGFHAVTIERVAQDCGITRTLIYQQFGTLTGMLEAMVDREFQRGSVGLIKAMQERPADKREQFVHTLAGIFKAISEAPATWRMFLIPSEGGPPELYRHLNQAVDFTHEFLRNSLEDMRGEGANLSQADPELTVRVMYALGDELIKLYLNDPENYPVERLLKQAQWLSQVLFR